MNHAIVKLTDAGVKSIRLDGVQAAIPLYHRLGFNDEYWSLRYTGVASGHDVAGITQMKEKDLPTVGDFDEYIFKASRHDVIRYTYEKKPELAFTKWEDEELTGYIMAKHGKTNIKIGPWLSKSPKVAEDLLKSVMNQVVGSYLWVGLPEGNKAGVEILERHGFKPLPSSLRMCHGDCSVVEDVEKVYGLGGPDKG